MKPAASACMVIATSGAVAPGQLSSYELANLRLVRSTHIKAAYFVKSQKLSRNEKSELTKENLYKSGLNAFAKYGFENASVARITDGAKVSIGTFYNYFETREQILSKIVISLGQELRGSISFVVSPDMNFFVREEKSFREYFRFLKKHPYYIKILNEAEIFLPDAYQVLVTNILDGYRKVLRDASRKKEIRPLRGIEVDGVALFLMAARHYYGQSFLSMCDNSGELPKNVVSIYLRFIGGGLKPNLDLEKE